MKVSFFLGFVNPFPAAGWTRIGFFAENWSKKSCIIEVFGIFSYKAFSKRGIKKLNNINIFNIIFSMNLMHPLIFILNTLISWMVSTLVLLSRRPNVAIVSVPTGDFGLGALLACKLTRIKCIVDYRDEWEDSTVSLVNSRFGKFFYYAIKRFATLLYIKSEFIAVVTPNFVKSLRSRGAGNVRLIPNGADAKTFKPAPHKKIREFFEIFYSGSVGGYYRLDVAVRALSRLKENGVRNIKLVIVGEGEVSKVLNLARELGVRDLIEYKGVINDKWKLAKLIAESDVGLVPYDGNLLWKNSLPAKFFEYCACGIPVIATTYDDSLLAKFIKRHEIGLIAPPMDDGRLAEAIYEVYQNSNFRELSRKRARAFIEEKFDRNKIAEEFLRLVEGCVNVGRK
jgi:glycosyltransferase involved in cell wall biosynthesis